jgi:prolyl-tRNA editing enzyme YbaK/EbsC (Cys-tRNA(Pro) deacylase)
MTFLHGVVRDYEEVRAAAGLPNAVFALTPADPARLTGAGFVDVARR